MMIGAAFGYLTLIWTTEAFGRRLSYFIFNICALLSSLYLFWYVKDLGTLMWFMLVYGYFVIGGFGTFAVYLPELYPTRVRATGQGFCWNAARSLTAIGPLVAGSLVAEFGSFPAAAGAVAFAYVVGAVVIWMGPGDARRTAQRLNSDFVASDCREARRASAGCASRAPWSGRHGAR